MPIFNRIKQLNELRKTSQTMQKELAGEVWEVIHKGVRIQVRGDMQLNLLESHGKSDQDILLAVNKALKESQKRAAQKMRGRLGDLGLDLGI